jgi:hypothetical protein
MAIDSNDLESLVRLVREHPEWREALRRELLTDDLLTLPAAGRLERALEALAAAQDRTEAQVAANHAYLTGLLADLAKQSAQTDARLEALAKQSAETDARLAEMDARLGERLDALAKQSAETDARLEEYARQAREMDARLSERMEALAKQSAETDARLEEYARQAREMDARLSERMEALAKQSAENEVRWTELRAEHEKTMARVDVSLAQIAALTEAFKEQGERIDRRFNALEGRVGNLEGQMLELRYNVGSQLSTILRRVRPVTVGDLDRVLDARDSGALPEDRFRQLQAADFICIGREGKGPDAPEAYAVVEVSRVIDVNDVDRAADRAEVLRQCGYPRVYAAVGGEAILADARARAAERGVHVLGVPAEVAPAAA